MSTPREANSGAAFDAESLRHKYREERDKRLRKDGADQFIRLAHHVDAFGAYLRDPWAEGEIARPALAKDVDTVIIGGGLGGLLTACRLRELGISDFHIVDKAGDFGGTWYWNRYPGIACDVESYIYMPMLERLGKTPTERYASGPEILRHCQDLARHFDLYAHALFQTQVTEMRWDEARGRWLVGTDRGDRIMARFVVMSTGPLNQPKLPGVPGLGSFKGHSFHTSRWDYDYTGGSARGGLTKLGDKRVGIIGTGATGIQCIPHLGQAAKHLYVFQRTPSAVQPRGNRPTDPRWASELKPGWQAARMENFSAVVMGAPVEDMVRDGWTEAFPAVVKHATLPPAEAANAMEAADFQQMEKVRRRIDETVTDPATAAALKPHFGLFCKRLCFHDEYLPTFNRPNVTLVDTKGKGVARIVENGVVVEDRTYELDCLIFATGFEWYAEDKVGPGFETYGRGGLPQSQAWAEGVLSLYGPFSRDFPNRFIIGNSQQAHGVNFTHMLEIMGRHIAGVIKHALDRNIQCVEPSEAAQRAWVDGIVAVSERRRGYSERCTPGYYNNEGQFSLKTARNSPYVAPLSDFDRMLEKQRETGNFDGLEMC